MVPHWQSWDSPQETRCGDICAHDCAFTWGVCAHLSLFLQSHHYSFTGTSTLMTLSASFQRHTCVTSKPQQVSQFWETRLQGNNYMYFLPILCSSLDLLLISQLEEEVRRSTQIYFLSVNSVSVCVGDVVTLPNRNHTSVICIKSSLLILNRKPIKLNCSCYKACRLPGRDSGPL